MKEKLYGIDNKVGAPILPTSETIGLYICLFEPPRISCEISDIGVGERKYTSSFIIEMKGEIFGSNAEMFKHRTCEINIETTPETVQDTLGVLGFYDTDFYNQYGYLGRVHLNLNIQFIRDLISFLTLHNLETNRHADKYQPEESENVNQFPLTAIKTVDLWIENEQRFREAPNSTRRRITYDVTKVEFHLWRDLFSNSLTKVRELLRTSRTFCQNAKARGYSGPYGKYGPEVSPLSQNAVTWSLLGAVRACYTKYDHDPDDEIRRIASHIVRENPSYKQLRDEEAIIRAFNDQEGYEAVKKLIDELDI